MSHPVQSNEPTMEEILASIRRIISDDDRAQDQHVEDRPEKTAPPPAGERRIDEPAPRAAAPDDATRDDSVSEEQDMAGQAKEKEEEDAGVFELTDEVGADDAGATGADETKAEAPQPEAGEKPAEVVFAENEEDMDKGFEGAAAEAGEAPQDLLSDKSHQSVQQTFASLENFVMSTHARTLEDLVSEMMRPILREWLDANLPPLTERLVREEIERVSRGRR